MKYLSVCSGIEAASVAWHPLGWKPYAFSEIEKFPSQVLAHHYPDVPNLGDMTKYQEWPDAAINLLVGGTPCQSFSVAGLRKGLGDPRGNLMLTYGAIAGRYRPRWLVWENVPGVLSSNGGRDFGTFLGMLAELGYGFAYRILDAQYIRVDGFARAVPQRRRRVFVVGYLGDWRRAAAVLFERESLCGHPSPSRKAGEGIAGGAASRVAGSGVAGCLNSAGGRAVPGNSVQDADQGFLQVVPPPLSLCLNAGAMGRLDAESETLIPTIGGVFDVAHTSYAIQAGALRTNPRSGPAGMGVQADHAYTLEARKEVQCVAFSCKDHGADAGEVSPTLRSMGHDGSHANGGGQVAVALALRGRDGGAAAELGDDCAFTLRAAQGGGDKPHVMCESLYNKGFTQGDKHASAQEANARTLLRELQEAIGEEAFAKWGLGILDSLQSPEILRQALHGGSIRPAAFSRSWVVYCALSRTEDGPTWLLQSLREAGCQRCASQGWQPSKQLSGELGAYLSELSQPGAQASRFMRDLWWSAQRAGVLREALSAVQEVGRSAYGQGQPTYGPMQVRRLTPEECEFLQGFPRGYTDIRHSGKPTPDGPRYKSLGNSMAIPPMRWLGQRIALVESIQALQEAA